MGAGGTATLAGVALMSVVDNYAFYFASTFQNKLYYFSTQKTTQQDARFSSVLWVFATCKILHNSVPSTPPELIVPSLDSLESQLSNDTRKSALEAPTIPSYGSVLPKSKMRLVEIS